MNRFKKKKAAAAGAAEASQSTTIPLPPPPPSATDATYHHEPDGEDYMSAAFLDPHAQAQDQDHNHKRGKKRALPPSPTTTTTTSRKAKALAEEEKLKEGLATPLQEDNLGLRLLKLMGYKPREGIGKSGTEGIKEPLTITKKTGRQGIGIAERQQDLKARQEQWNKIRTEMMEKRKEEFTAAMSNRFAERKVTSDLCKAMKTIETLDTRAGLERSCLWWSVVAEEQDEKERGEGGEKEEGTGDALLLTVPTREEALQTEQEEEGEQDQPPAAPSEEELWETLTNTEKLSVATAYLRDAYHYCLWCGHQYASAEEMQQDCPGETEEDH